MRRFWILFLLVLSAWLTDCDNSTGNDKNPVLAAAPDTLEFGTSNSSPQAISTVSGLRRGHLALGISTLLAIAAVS
jgi:hypothetical protein